MRTEYRVWRLTEDGDPPSVTRLDAETVLTEKDLEYVLKLVQRDLRYLRARRRDTTKVEKGGQLANKLLFILGRRTDAG